MRNLLTRVYTVKAGEGGAVKPPQTTIFYAVFQTAWN